MADDDLLNESDPTDTSVVSDPADDVSSAVDEALRQSREKSAAAEPSDAAAAPQRTVADRGDGRDPQGRFAPQQLAQVAPTAPTGPQPAADSQQAQQGLSRGALMRWQRAGFDQFPPEIKAAIAEREAEVDKGFAAWSDRLKSYEGLEKFDNFVKGANTSHAQVMDRAIAWEQATLRDPVGTAAHLMQLRGVDPIAAMVQIAASRGVPPAQLAQILNNPQALAQLRQRAAAPQMQQPRQQAPQPLSIDQIRATAREEYQRANAETRASEHTTQFLSDPKYPHAQNPIVQDAMIKALEDPAIPDLPSAYQKVMGDLSVVMAPAALNGQPRSQQAVAQARQAAKATVGAPSGGRTPAASAGNPKTLDEALDMAVAMHRR